MPLLSVLIPTCNYKCYTLVADLHTQLQASGIEYEIILAEDGSRDQVSIISNHRITELPHCRHIINRENVGRALILNQMIAQAKGEWCLLTDSDAKVVRNDFISKYLSGSENLGLVCQLIDIRHKPLESDLECYQWLKECGLRVQVVLTKSDKLSKNAAMSQKALFKRELGLSEDEIITYTSSQHTNRSELINRIMASLVDNGVEEEQEA